MGRQRLNVKLTSVRLFEHDLERISARVGAHGLAKFVRAAIVAELDRLEQDEAEIRAIAEQQQGEERAEADAVSPVQGQMSSAGVEPSTRARRRGQVTHGHGVGHTSKTYDAWRSMKERCERRSHPSYRYCGARGIKYHSSWARFEAFLHDMGQKPPAKKLVRRDVNKDFGPDNCFWGTGQDQSRSRRIATHITYRGRTGALTAWAEETGIPYATLHARIKKGWEVERALTAPVRPGPPRTRTKS